MKLKSFGFVTALLLANSAFAQISEADKENNPLAAALIVERSQLGNEQTLNGAISEESIEVIFPETLRLEDAQTQTYTIVREFRYKTPVEETNSMMPVLQKGASYLRMSEQVVCGKYQYSETVAEVSFNAQHQALALHEPFLSSRTTPYEEDELKWMHNLAQVDAFVPAVCGLVKQKK